MTRDDDVRITDWLATGEGHSRIESIDAALAAARSTTQRPAWVVRLGGGTFPASRGAVSLGRGLVMLGAVLLVALLLGGLAAGGMLPLRLTARPTPPVAAIVIAGPSDGPHASSAAPSDAPARVVAYDVVDCVARTGNVSRCSTSPWLATADGRDAHVVEGTSVVGWSADGSRLVTMAVEAVGGAVSLLVEDPTGAVVKRVDVACTFPSVNEKGLPDGHLCPDPDYGAALSPDGTRVALVRTDPNDHDSSVISIVDLSTGQSILLPSTRATNPPTPELAPQLCNTSTKFRTCQGHDGNPRWSPDGRTIAFERQTIAPGPGDAWDGAALFVVDADGSDLQRVTPSGVHAMDASWSVDGTRLVFVGSDYVVSADGATVRQIKNDIYVIGMDGSGLIRLTDDGTSALPNWTSGGGVAFVRDSGPTTGSHWIMDADGGNQRPVRDSLPDLTAAGCTICVHVAQEPVNGELPRAYWQPRP